MKGIETFPRWLSALTVLCLTVSTGWSSTIVFSNTASQDFGTYPGSDRSTDFTCILADDLLPAPGYEGWMVNRFGVQIRSSSSSTVSFQAFARFWSQSANGLPGAYLSGYDFGTIALDPGETRWLEAAIGGFALPAETLWAGMQFRLFDFFSAIPEVVVADPPDIGTSNNYFFFSDASADLAGVDNPSGGLYWFGGSPIANFAWVIEAIPVAVPEPGTLMLLGTGLAGFGVAAWRRRK